MDQDDAATFLDSDDEPNAELNRISNAIIGAAIEVHRQLGPGHLESAYETALAIEVDLRGTRYERQAAIDRIYKGFVVGKGRLDFLVEERVIVDLNAVSAISQVDVRQMISYLSMTGHRLGIILNFNVAALRQGIKRIAGRPRIER